MGVLRSAHRHSWVVSPGTVDEVLPRRSELQDPAVANVDQVLLVFALERPPLDLRTATRWAHPICLSHGCTM